MSWADFITHVLATTSKVDRVLVFDNQGSPVAVTGGVETSETEGQALAMCLLDRTMLLCELHVDGDAFCCIQGEDNNLVGRGVKDKDLVIAAVTEGDNSVAFIGRNAGKGSFIFELQDCLTLRAQGRLLPQLQRQQQQQQEEQMVMTDDVSGEGTGSAGAAIGGAPEVLVDIQ